MFIIYTYLYLDYNVIHNQRGTHPYHKLKHNRQQEGAKQERKKNTQCPVTTSSISLCPCAPRY